LLSSIYFFLSSSETPSSSSSYIVSAPQQFSEAHGSGGVVEGSGAEEGLVAKEEGEGEDFLNFLFIYFFFNYFLQ